MMLSMADRAFRLMAVAPIEGCLVEFGVYQGAGLASMARLAGKYLSALPPIYGFDSFSGMPASGERLEGALEKFWAPGTFSDTSLESVEARLRGEGVQARLVKGVFSELRPLAEYAIRNVRFAHLDGDIYEGYRDALRLLTPHLTLGTVLLFDETVPPTEWRYQSVREHGQRALREWEQQTGFNLHRIRFEWTAELCVLVDEDYLRTNWKVIVRLRKDTIQESLGNIARILLAKELEPRVHLD
jgi:hypothetical protein